MIWALLFQCGKEWFSKQNPFLETAGLLNLLRYSLLQRNP